MCKGLLRTDQQGENLLKKSAWQHSLSKDATARASSSSATTVSVQRAGAEPLRA